MNKIENLIANLIRGIANVVLVLVCVIGLFIGMADLMRTPQQVMNDYITEEFGDEYTGVILEAPGLYGDDYRVCFEVRDPDGLYKCTVRV